MTAWGLKGVLTPQNFGSLFKTLGWLPGIYSLLIRACGYGLDAALTSHHTYTLATQGIPLPVGFLLTLLSPLF